MITEAEIKAWHEQVVNAELVTLELCASGGDSWRTCIPVQPDDTDIVLSAALRVAYEAIDEVKRLCTEVEAYKRHFEDMVGVDVRDEVG